MKNSEIGNGVSSAEPERRGSPPEWGIGNGERFLPHSPLPTPFSLLVLFFLVTLASCQPKVPQIYSIHPQIGAMGEPVTIKGDFFGKERNESYVTIAGAQPTSKSYLNWQDNEITFRIPEFGEAGLVYVYVKGRKSNAMLFANQATLPVQVQVGEMKVGPRITSVSPQSGGIGTLLVITGTGFGSSRNNSGVFFPWNAQAPVSAPAEARIQEFTEVSEAEFGYEMWTDREIHIRVPDGAVGGNMEIRTVKGNSPPAAFGISGRPGTKIFHDKRTFTLTYSVTVKAGAAKPPNTLYLWIPSPALSASQRNMELLSSSLEPFIEKYRGISLYKMDNLITNREARINLSWKVDVYGVETAVSSQSVRQEDASPMSALYTQSSSLIPSDDIRMKNQAAAIVGRERNPYVKAQKIYEWMTAGGNFFWGGEPGDDIFFALENKHLDSYLATLLYCTLLRSADVPCQPVAGVLANREQQAMHHYWAEFWLDGFGWIPVDPAMGAGHVSAPFDDNSGGTAFYFGNMDSWHIAFSRGYTVLSPMDPQGRTSAPGRFYSLQNIREEAVGGLDSYSTLWGDIIITGIYAQ